MASEISQMSDSSIVIIQGTVGLYTVATRCHTCFAVTLKYTEDSSLTILRHSLMSILPILYDCKKLLLNRVFFLQINSPQMKQSQTHFFPQKY